MGGWDYSGHGDGGENRLELGCALETELRGRFFFFFLGPHPWPIEFPG